MTYSCQGIDGIVFIDGLILVWGEKMTKAFDYKKEYKDLYLPKADPMIIDVPEMTFLMVNGKGDPNKVDGEYQQAVELLYALSYTIKMSKKGTVTLSGYFEYVVPPLEGLWWLEDISDFDLKNKDKYCWTSMIRQPEFVTDDVFLWACDQVRHKKPDLDVSKVRVETFTEGLCVQAMHFGAFDDEYKTVEKIKSYTEQHGLLDDFSDTRHHHEIYLSDPRKVDVTKMNTVLRHPVRRAVYE